ncbi:hypothetical protein [Caballeronia ptereochthonis]|uniref:Uncharacterized protein n=1 Tax=Caballeronia ptereochthonis TaxID=1777144 RepID=A0A158B9E6_9BURK|nr:hypothetical protein [Caballeronia ptereochthonis]SAK66702.1 hypothetical protein AWB83_02984 [Caballeronia ptereochthonis]
MRSELIRGTARSELDPQIMEFVSRHACGAKPLIDMRVGIKNEIGEVYRLIIVDGVIEMIRMSKFLFSIGCTEEPTDEFDELFRVPSSWR